LKEEEREPKSIKKRNKGKTPYTAERSGSEKQT
jgi:hypothetical protein